MFQNMDNTQGVIFSQKYCTFSEIFWNLSNLLRHVKQNLFIYTRLFIPYQEKGAVFHAVLIVNTHHANTGIIYTDNNFPNTFTST